MATAGLDAGQHLSLQPHHHHHRHQTEPATEPALREVQRWLEVSDVTALRYAMIQMY